MPITVNEKFKNLPKGLVLPDRNLNIFTGPNNSGKSSILQYLNSRSELKDRADYISPRRFDLSNQIALALNSDDELRNMWTQRKSFNENVAELEAPDSIRELISLPNTARNQVIDWHNRYFGELKAERSKDDNEFAPARVTIDGRLATQQGSGSRSVLSVLCVLLHPGREIILIDEPEIGIEPQVQKRLSSLIKKIVRGDDGLPKKKVYLATHSHLFLDKDVLENNWIVTKDKDGNATLTQVTRSEELHDLIFRMLGNSPDDLFFPDNILIVEGPSDETFWRKLLVLSGVGGVAVHYADGDSGVGAALPAIDQMLKTQAYIPWYRDHLCVAVDSSVSAVRINEWRAFLDDDGRRVRKLSRNGIEYYYPSTVMTEITGMETCDQSCQIEAYIDAIKKVPVLPSWESSREASAL